MGIYIHGISMPKDGECVVVFPGGVVQKYKAGGIAFFEYQGRTEETVAVQLPPHGRLIDASEKVTVHYDEYIKKEMTIDELLRCGWIESKAPTIVPADPEGGADNG